MRLMNPKKYKTHPRNERNLVDPGEQTPNVLHSSETRNDVRTSKRCLATFHAGCKVTLLLEDACVGSAELMLPGDGAEGDVFKRVLHGCNLKEFGRPGEDLVVIWNVKIEPHALRYKYPYLYGGVDPPPQRLSGLCRGFHSWDRHCMRPELNERNALFSTEKGAGVHRTEGGGRSMNDSQCGVRGNCNDVINTGKKATSEVETQTAAQVHAQPLRGADVHVKSGTRSKPTEERRFPQGTSPGADAATEGRIQVHPGGVLSEHAGAATETNPVATTETNPVATTETNPVSRVYNNHVLRAVEPTESEEMAINEIEGRGRSTVEDSTLRFDDGGDSSSTTSLSPVRKRSYRFINRRPREVGEEPNLVKKRRVISTSFTNTNIAHMKCCSRLDCFQRTDRSYLRAQVGRVLKMTQDDRRAVLEGMLDKELQVFLFNGKRVCATFLEHAFGFSRYLQSRAKRTPGSIRRYEHGATEDVSWSVKQRDSIVCYLERLAESTADIMPDCQEYHLPFFRKDDVYKDFCKEYAILHERKDPTCSRKTDPPTSSYFYAMWARHCSNIKVRNTHRFTKCGECERLRASLEAKRTDAKATAALRQKKKEHNEMVSRERREYAKKCQTAVLYPDEYCSIVVDGADQSAFGLPHFKVSVKEARGHCIGVKLIGVLEHGANKKVSLFLMTEQYETGANHIIEAVHRHLTQKVLTARLPPTLYIQADNCQRENKNQFFFGYCESLVAWGVFCEVYVSFLPIGHTHSDIDQVFSRTSTRLRHQDAVTMEELMVELEKSYTPEPSVVHMRGIINFSGLCKEQKCSSSVTGFTENRYFRFIRNSAATEHTESHYSTTCLVRMSCDDDWTPLRGEDEPGFLVGLPDLARTPCTVVKAPDNIDEVNRRLQSEENRIQRHRMKALEDLRDEVYNSGEESFHWNLATCFEMNGRYARNRVPNDGDSDEDGEDTPEADLEYERNEFVATKADSEVESVPFMVGRIMEMEKNSSGVIFKLVLHWYEMYKGSSVYKGKYRPSYKGRGRERRAWIDKVSVNTVVHKFRSFTRGRVLTVGDRKSIWQALH